MLYFKNPQLAEEQHVTLRTVLNWIQAAKDGRLDLDLHASGDRTHIANTARNAATIARLVDERRKYQNQRASKTVEPKPEFYELFSEAQIYDIITNLEIHREIPRQYSYFNSGAKHWDDYAKRLAAETTPNLVGGTIELLRLNVSYIDGLLARYKKVNVIDVGVGNAYPVRGLLTHLIEQDKLGRYIAIDISPTMLDIAKQNIKEWFGDLVAFEGHKQDINYERFSHLFLEEYTDGKDTVNLILLLGGTVSNMRYPDAGYRIIHDSMGRNDLLIHTVKLDNKYTRRFFDFAIQPGEARLPETHSLVPELLNIEPSFYDVTLGYDPELKQRFEKVKLKNALTLRFAFNAGVHTIKLQKGDELLVWRYMQQSANEVRQQFDRNDLYLLHTSQTEDQEYMLTISRVKRD